MSKVTITRKPAIPVTVPIESVEIQSLYDKKFTASAGGGEIRFAYPLGPGALIPETSAIFDVSDTREFANALLELCDQVEGK